MAKLFFKRAVQFTIVFMAVNAILVYSYNNLVMKESLLRKKEIGLKNNKKPLDYLFVGDSRIAASINTRIIPNSYNYASSGESYQQNYYKLRNLDKVTDVPIKNIVMPMGYQSLCSYRKYRLIDEGFWATKIRLLDYTPSIDNYEFIAKVIQGHLFPYMGKLDNINDAIKIKRGTLERLEILDGVEQRKTCFMDLPDPEKNVQEALERHFKGYEVIDEDTKNILRAIYDYCEKTDRNLILVRFPISKAYFDGLDQYIDPQAYQKEVDELLAEFPTKVAFYNFEQAFDKQDGYFSDADHLNLYGAEVLSKMLRDSLLNQ